MASDVTLSVGGGNPVYGTPQDEGEVGRASPLRQRLADRATHSTVENLASNADTFRLEAPECSVYKSVGDGITRQLTGFNKSEIKQGFKRAWQKDKNLGLVLGGLKMSVRCIGFAVGSVINLAGRLATLPVAIAFGVATAVLQFIFTPVKTFKKPREVLENAFIGGVVGGVTVGSCIGIIGMGISKTLTGIKLDRESDGKKIDLFERTVGDNAIIGMVGAGTAVGVSLLYPAMWQLPFRTGE
jgi:hypothetical protein